MHRLLSITLALLALAAATPGPAMAQTPEKVHDGATYWQGQTLERSDGIPNGATASVRATSHQHYQEYSAGRDGTITFDTSNYKAGTYSLRVQGSEIARFHIEVQSMKISTASVDSDTGHANFTIQSPRASFDLAVNSSRLTTRELAAVFGDYTTNAVDVDNDTREELVIRDVRRSQQLQGDFANYRGTHTLRFDVLDTDAAAKAKVSVGWPSHQQVALLDDEIVDHRGDIVPIRVALPKTNTAKLHIGSSDVNYLLNATVHDRDGDNRVTVHVHTREMGQPGGTLTADSGRVAITNETMVSGQIDVAEYPVSVVDDGGDHDDAATLELERGESKHAYSYTYPKDKQPGSWLEIRDGSRDGTVVDNESIALVYEVSGVYSAVEDADVGDLADGSDGIQLEIVGERRMNADERPTLDVSDGRLYTKPADETLAVVLDTEDVQASPGSEYNATLRFTDRELSNLTTAFTVQAPEVSFKRPLPATQTQIRGQTVYENGSTVTLGIWARDGNIQQSRQVSVGDGGRIQAPVDLRALAGEPIQVRLKSVGDWQKIPVRESAGTTTTATPRVQETTTTTPPPTTRQTATTAARETTTTQATTTATPPPSTATATAPATATETRTVTPTTSVPDPDSGLFAGLWSTVGWGVIAVGGALVAANRIAD